ncbi:Plasmodium exported protein, unknown function, putative [Plasmodium sp.]|nr:Plasmodium exported protein, unknown function, putative [Plasmodium sp.]
MYFMEVDLNDLFIYNNNIKINIILKKTTFKIQGKFVISYCNNISSNNKYQLISGNEKVQLKTSGDENNNDIPFGSEGSNKEDYVKYDIIIWKNFHLMKIFMAYGIRVLGIAKEEFDDMLKELSFYIEDYLYKYEY